MTAAFRSARGGPSPAALLEAILASMTQGVMVYGPDGEVLRINRAAERILGVAEAEWAAADGPRGRAGLVGLEKPDGSPIAIEETPTWKALHGDVPRDMELRLRKPGGESTWVLASAVPVEAPDGSICGAVATYSDVTEQRWAEEQLRESEEEARARAVQLEAVLDTIADGVIVYDPQGRTVRSSPAADAILGIPVQDRDLPVEERVMRQYEILSEDGRRQEREDMVAVRSAVHAETVPGALYSVRSGDAAPRWLNISGKPLFVSGRHAGGVLCMTDMTERKHAEMALAVITRLYAVLSRVNEAIVRIRDEQCLYQEVCRIVSDEGGFPLVWVGLVEQRKVAVAASWGPAAGYLDRIRIEVEGELGQGPTGTCIREDHPVVNDDFGTNPATWPWREATRAHGLCASAAFPLHRGGIAIGAITFYAAKPGFFTVKQVALIESLCADVSFALDAMQQERLRSEAERELRQANESLQDADHRKDEFLAMLSHELRNPLAAIANSMYVLDHGVPGSEPVRHAQTVIGRQVGQLSRLVDDLLDVTRISRNKIQLQCQPTDLVQLARSSVDDHRDAFESQGVRLEFLSSEEPVWVMADAVRMTQIVGNLLFNAGKFTDPGGQVSLEIRTLGAQVAVAVTDTGIGMDREMLGKLFQPFAQADRSLDRSRGGLGLGLALSKGLAELHGGSLTATSAGLGQGSRFTLTLPTAQGPEQPEAEDPGSAPTTRPHRILVIEDNRDAAYTMKMLLELSGHEVITAHSGSAGITQAKAHRPEVIFCDIGLPDMDGYAVAQTLRSDPRLRITRLVAMTGYGQEEDKRRALAAGFDRHLTKPAAPEELQRVLGS